MRVPNVIAIPDIPVGTTEAALYTVLRHPFIIGPALHTGTIIAESRQPTAITFIARILMAMQARKFTVSLVTTTAMRIEAVFITEVATWASAYDFSPKESSLISKPAAKTGAGFFVPGMRHKPRGQNSVDGHRWPQVRFLQNASTRKEPGPNGETDPDSTSDMRPNHESA